MSRVAQAFDPQPDHSRGIPGYSANGRVGSNIEELVKIFEFMVMNSFRKAFVCKVENSIFDKYRFGILVFQVGVIVIAQYYRQSRLRLRVYAAKKN